MTGLLSEYSPSGFPIVRRVHESIYDRPHETSLIAHPRFPQGSAHFLHPSTLFRPYVSVCIPGVPFALSVSQRQTALTPGDDTGFAVWRAATVLCSYLVVHRESFQHDCATIELGCGAGAIVSSVAAWLGFNVEATDGCETVLSDTRASIAAHAQASGFKSKYVTVSKLEWSKDQAQNFVKSRGGRKYQLILGSEIIYSLRSQSASSAHSNFSQLVATLDALLAHDGQVILAWNPRSMLESIFFDILSSYNFIASAPLNLSNLHLHHSETDGIKLVRIARLPKDV